MVLVLADHLDVLLAVLLVHSRVVVEEEEEGVGDMNSNVTNAASVRPSVRPFTSHTRSRR